MALTEGAKRYIAKYLGIVKNSDYCFSDTTATSVKYWDASDESHMGSTLDAVSTIVKFGGYSYEDKVAETGKIDAAKLTSENGGTALTDDDIIWIANHSDGADKYCYSEGTPTPVTGKTNLCVLTDPDLADVYVDDVYNADLSPSRSDPPWKCTEVTAAPRPAGITHKVTAKKTGYKDAEEPVVCFEGEDKYIYLYLEPEAGPGVGVLELRAYKAGTTEEIQANFDIEGISGEEKYLTPHTMNVKAGTYDWIRFYCTGFEDYEVKNVVVKEGETTTVTAYMKPKKLWKEVYVGPPITLVTLVDFDIPSRLYWDNTYDFSVTLRCFESGWYYANMELRDPGKFLETGDPADLGATKWTIDLPEVKIEFKDIGEKVKLKTSRRVPGSSVLPAGTYIVVAVAYTGRRGV